MGKHGLPVHIRLRQRHVGVVLSRPRVQLGIGGRVILAMVDTPVHNEESATMTMSLVMFRVLTARMGSSGEVRCGLPEMPCGDKHQSLQPHHARQDHMVMWKENGHESVWYVSPWAWLRRYVTWIGRTR
jgi:hypothetical protein